MAKRTPQQISADAKRNWPRCYALGLLRFMSIVASDPVISSQALYDLLGHKRYRNYLDSYNLTARLEPWSVEDWFTVHSELYRELFVRLTS